MGQAVDCAANAPWLMTREPAPMVQTASKVVMEIDVDERSNRDLIGEKSVIENCFEARPSGCTTLILVVFFEYANAGTFGLPDSSGCIQHLPS